MNHHDPVKQVRYLKDALSQSKSKLGFFLAAGCPVSIKIDDEKEKDKKKPLIPDIAGLTDHVLSNLGNEDRTSHYSKLVNEVVKTGLEKPNIEQILSFGRALRSVSAGGEVRGFSETDLSNLEKDICDSIVEVMRVSHPNFDTPYHDFANWINSLEREHAVEIFTTNYDLLLEEAFEEYSIPYFDGFVGARKSFFDLRAVEEREIPKHWTRFWKIHGSLNWYLDGNDNVYRALQKSEDEDSYLIYPSHLKYDESRKMPFLVCDRTQSVPG